jgi:hypothetical protein
LNAISLDSFSSSPASNPRTARFLLTPLVRGSVGQAKASNRFGGFRCGDFGGKKPCVIAGETRNDQSDYGLAEAAHGFYLFQPLLLGENAGESIRRDE